MTRKPRQPRRQRRSTQPVAKDNKQADRPAIRFPQHIRDLINERWGETRHRSEAVRCIVARYCEICRLYKPQLPPVVWKVLLDVLRYPILQTEDDVRVMVGTIVEEAKRRNILEKWGVTALGLRTELKDMIYVELVAIADACERFWEAPEGQEPPLPWQD